MIIAVVKSSDKDSEIEKIISDETERNPLKRLLLPSRRDDEDKKKKLTFKQELEALRTEVAELEKDEALMSDLFSESQEIYIGMIQTGEL